jgi:hypothetical protein
MDKNHLKIQNPLIIKDVDPATPKNEISQKYATFLIIKISKKYQEQKDFSSLQNG